MAVRTPGLAVGQSHLLYGEPMFQAKMAVAQARIIKALKRSKRPYVAFSGGIDSEAVVILTLAVAPDVSVFWSDDELEYPETVDLMTALHGDGQFVIARGYAEHAGWFRPWRDEPFWRDPLPGTLTAGMEADDFMASRGHDLTLLGTRADESRKRRQWFAANGGTYKVQTGTGRRCCPIHDWDKDLVWALIGASGIAYNRAYDRLTEIGIHRERQRIGPLPLTPRPILAEGWPELLDRLEARYQRRWS